MNPKSSSPCLTCTFTYSTSLLTGIFTATGAENFIVHSTFPVITSVHVSSAFSKYTSNHHSYSTVLSDVTLISDSFTFVVPSSFFTSFDSTSFDTNVNVVDQLNVSSVVSSHTVTVVVLVYTTFFVVISSAFSSSVFHFAYNVLSSVIDVFAKSNGVSEFSSYHQRNSCPNFFGSHTLFI
ncbi:hypothetical protein IKN40_01975 [bacterium]|nr:hypothetical protein [bacterium]